VPICSPRTRVVVAAFGLGLAGLAIYEGVQLGAPGDKWCNQHVVGCGFGIHLTGTLVAGVLAYLSFYRLVVEPRVVFPILQAGPRSPTKLFRWLADATAYENLVRRKDFVRELVDDVAHSRIRDDVTHAQIPHVIVGDGGSGKTAALVAVAAEISRRGMVPVPITLRDLHRRDATGLDFTRLAREAFVSHALHGGRSGRTLSTEAVEKVWRKLRPRVVVLVDDVEKVQRGREDLRTAFAVARTENLMLIAASRLDGMPPGLEASVVELDGLNEADVVDEILKCGRKRNREAGGRRLARDEVERLVARADVTSTPYFMRLAMRLARTGRLPTDLPANRARARLALLDAFHETLQIGGVGSEDGLTSVDRNGILADLERLACQSLGRRPTRPEAERVPAERGRLKDATQCWPGRLGEAVPPVIRIRNRERLGEGGERIGVIRTRRASDLRFTHQVLQAYFASRLLRRPEAADLRAELVDRNPASPYLAMALVLAAAAPSTETGRASCAAEVCDVLLRSAAADGQDDDLGGQTSRLNLITAAVEVAALLDSDRTPLAVRAAGLAATVRPAAQTDDAATRRIKLQLIHELSALGGHASIEALWVFADDPDYSVRWHAVLGITSADEHRFLAVESIASEAIDRVKRLAPSPDPIDDNGPSPAGEALSRLKPVAWMLPALHSDAVREERVACAERLEIQLREIDEASRLSTQHGVLASIAQGFKLDSVRCAEHPDGYPPNAIHERLFSLLDTVPFWYTKVVLLHAISLKLIAMQADGSATATATSAEAPSASRPYLGSSLSRDDAERRLAAFLEQRAMHPFVRAAGELCQDALRAAPRGRSWREYIWTEDEAEVIARPPRNLHPKALHLVADIALLLNLNEQDRSAHERARFGEHRELPACLGAAGRRLILDDHLPLRECPVGCPFSGDEHFRPLCPDKLPRWAADDVSGQVLHSRRLLNRSFCRRLRHTASHQSWLAGDGSGNRSRLRRRDRKAHVARVRDFWAKMEHRSSI